MRTRYGGSPAVAGPEGLRFGVAPRPLVVGRGLELGAGTVHPEINFTLPPMTIDDRTWPDVLTHYRQTGRAIVERAKALELPGLMIEFEHLPPMTEAPERGAELTAILREALGVADAAGIRTALRVTITDLRDGTRPPRLRDGPAWDSMRESWRRCAAAGADGLSIESVGGKEVHDPALVEGDLPGIVFGLGVLAARDMEWLWSELVPQSRNAVPGADAACGFANTAMQLAQQRMLPQVLAAVIRAMGAARSLVAFECGARGPSKDCAYEGPILKAITGCPIAMEGKSAACAHSSPVGNVAAMAADLWSNESVQNVRLLSGGAPEAFLEILAYDCRLLNAASAAGQADILRDLLVASDERRSPQALVLGPRAAHRIARAILAHADDDLARTLAAGREAAALIAEAAAGGTLRLSPVEAKWLDRIRRGFDAVPESPGALAEAVGPRYGDRYALASYGLSGNG